MRSLAAKSTATNTNSLLLFFGAEGNRIVGRDIRIVGRRDGRDWSCSSRSGRDGRGCWGWVDVVQNGLPDFLVREKKSGQQIEKLVFSSIVKIMKETNVEVGVKEAGCGGGGDVQMK